jgi:uridylate kinase
MEFKRILLKLSGELLKAGDNPLDDDKIAFVCEEIISAKKAGAQLAIVAGGGNIFRGGRSEIGTKGRLLRTLADQTGMMATVVNAQSIAMGLLQRGEACRIMSAVEIPGFVDLYSPKEAVKALEEGEILFFAGGLGHPYFTTDTASAIRALEINADAIFKATKVDGVYDKDPMKYADAARFDRLEMSEAIERNLKVMDRTAFSVCQDGAMKIVVFKLAEKGDLAAALSGDGRKTVVVC